MILPLQSLAGQAPDPEQIKQVQDSLRNITIQLAENLKTDPQATLEEIGHQAIHFGLKVLVALLIYAVGMWLIRRIKAIMRRRMERRGTDRTVITFTLSITTAVLTILLVVISIGTLGVNTSSLAALLAGASVAIGMALSGTMQNFAGGIIVLIFKPFKAGDYIRTQGYEGTVKEVSMVSTTLTTYDNKEVIIPNGSLSSGIIDNFSRNPIRRLDFKVGVEYGTDESACISKLLEIASSDSRILDETFPGAKPPFSAVSALNDSNVEFLLRVWVKAEDYWAVHFDTWNAIYKQLPESGISFAFPHMDVTFRNS